MRRRLAVVDRVPGLVEPLHSGAEPEPEAAARHLVDVQGGDRQDEGAAGECPGDAGPDADLLRLGGEPGRLGDRAAEQLRRPDAVDAGGLGGARLLGEVLRRVSDRGDRDAVEGGHAFAADLQAVLLARVSSANVRVLDVSGGLRLVDVGLDWSRISSPLPRPRGSAERPDLIDLLCLGPAPSLRELLNLSRRSGLELLLGALLDLLIALLADRICLRDPFRFRQARGRGVAVVISATTTDRDAPMP